MPSDAHGRPAIHLVICRWSLPFDALKRIERLVRYWARDEGDTASNQSFTTLAGSHLEVSGRHAPNFQNQDDATAQH